MKLPDPRPALRRFGKRFYDAHTAHPRLYLLWCFLVPAFLMFAVHAFFGVYPFWRNSVLVLDLNGQYVYFFEALRRCVYGDASFLYSFSRNLGGEFVGIYAYYLASPLSYIVCLFPKDMILEALYAMFVLKCGLCGLTCGYFLHKTGNCRRLTVLLFSSCYALSGYAMIMQHNTMWTDCVILLPLICLGIRSLIFERKYKLYVAALSVAILSNFYIGYMMCIFVFLYYFYCYFSSEPIERNPRGERCHFLRASLRMGIFSVIALLISALIIIPAYYSLTFGKTTFTDPVFTFTSKFDLFDIFGMFFFNSYDTVRPEGLPILYCGILTLILIPFYFVSRKISVRRRLASALLVFVLLLSFSIKYLDLIWHGFQNPNWLNYRYSFMLIFLLCGMGASVFDKLRDFKRSTFITVSSLLLLLLFVAQTFDYGFLDGFTGVYPDLAFLIIYTVLLCLLVSPFLFRRMIARRILAAIVCLELFLSAFLNLVALDKDVVVSTRDSYLDYNRKWQGIVDMVETQDPGFYRMEILHHQKTNDPYSLGYYGLSGSTSTLNAKVIDFLQSVGVSSRSHWSVYCSSSPVSDSFLGLKYILTNADDDSRMSQLYDRIYADETVAVYENPYVLPIAFCVDPEISDITFIEPEEDENSEINDTRTYYKTSSPFERLNIIIRTMLSNDESSDLYTRISTQVKRENLNFYPLSTHTLYKPVNEDEQASITFTITGDGIHEVYAYFPTLYLRSCTYYINGAYAGWMLTGDTDGYFNLGVISKNRELTFKIVLRSDDKRLYLYSGNQYFFYLDDSLFTSAFETLREGGLVIDSFSDDSITGHLTSTAGRTTVQTTIPYDKGWRVTVDGEDVGVFETLDALLAFEVTEGTHEISMRYMPDEYVLAFRLCVIGSLSFLMIMSAEFVYKKIRAARKRDLPAAEVRN